jgi:hypothetical protein
MEEINLSTLHCHDFPHRELARLKEHFPHPTHLHTPKKETTSPLTSQTQPHSPYLKHVVIKLVLQGRPHPIEKPSASACATCTALACSFSRAFVCLRQTCLCSSHTCPASRSRLLERRPTIAAAWAASSPLTTFLLQKQHNPHQHPHRYPHAHTLIQRRHTAHELVAKHTRTAHGDTHESAKGYTHTQRNEEEG